MNPRQRLEISFENINRSAHEAVLDVLIKFKKLVRERPKWWKRYENWSDRELEKRSDK